MNGEELCLLIGLVLGGGLGYAFRALVQQQHRPLYGETWHAGAAQMREDIVDALKDWGHNPHAKATEGCDDECAVCGVLACPHFAGEHFWKDGCPACWEDHQKQQQQQEMSKS